jgi:hypothetical protein
MSACVLSHVSCNYDFITWVFIVVITMQFILQLNKEKGKGRREKVLR